jgi:hypothetical protein
MLAARTPRSFQRAIRRGSRVLDGRLLLACDFDLISG